MSAYTPEVWTQGYEPHSHWVQIEGQARGINCLTNKRARLIAAAPDLLAALEQIITGYGVTFQDAAILREARAAIAKATS